MPWVKTATLLIEALKTEFKPSGGDLGPQVMEFFQKKTLEILEPLQHGAPKAEGRAGAPAVIMVVGVNGAGKTTTIGKLAYAGQERGRRVVLAAADTYRAAGGGAARHLGRAGGRRHRAERHRRDPAAVVFDA